MYCFLSLTSVFRGNAVCPGGGIRLSPFVQCRLTKTGDDRMSRRIVWYRRVTADMGQKLTCGIMRSGYNIPLRNTSLAKKERARCNNYTRMFYVYFLRTECVQIFLFLWMLYKVSSRCPDSKVSRITVFLIGYFHNFCGICQQINYLSRFNVPF